MCCLNIFLNIFKFYDIIKLTKNINTSVYCSSCPFLSINVIRPLILITAKQEIDFKNINLFDKYNENIPYINLEF